MSKYCPILQKKVVYLTCEDCDDRGKCHKNPPKRETLKEKSQKNCPFL